MDEFQIPNNEKQSYYDNEKDIIIKNDFQKNGYEKKSIYQNQNNPKTKLYEFQYPKIIINPKYNINDELNKNNAINYLESITNRKLYQKRILENEKNDISSEKSDNIEDCDNESDSKMRYEYREEIISYPKFRNIKYYYNKTTEDNIDKNNNELKNSFLYNTQKPPIKFIFDKKINDKKYKTVVLSSNYNNTKNILKHEFNNDYNVKFPKEDKPSPIQEGRQSNNSSDDENINTLKFDIENLKKYDTSKIINKNNIFHTKFKTESFENKNKFLSFIIENVD